MNPALKAVFGSRFFLVPVLLALAIVLWNLYVDAHNDGIVRGLVVGPDGQPVAGATVSMLEQNFNTNSPRASTTADAQGRFEFTDNRSHSIQLRAEKAGLGQSEQQPVRLYFQAQHVELVAPLRIGAEPSGG